MISFTKSHPTILLPFLILLILPTVLAQTPEVTYTVHIDFFAIACSISIRQVTLYDQSGNSLATTSSPYGVEVAITFRTPTAIQSITAAAFGQTTLGSYYSASVSGTQTVSAGPGGDYWIAIRLS
ncbi:MAG TPA: hypothetical protein VLV18_07260 [Terriglobales bacterium]|nr:hypothetical protein [Terriglobales bacterium]